MSKFGVEDYYKSITDAEESGRIIRHSVDDRYWPAITEDTFRHIDLFSVASINLETRARVAYEGRFVSDNTRGLGGIERDLLRLLGVNDKAPKVLIFGHGAGVEASHVSAFGERDGYKPEIHTVGLTPFSDRLRFNPFDNQSDLLNFVNQVYMQSGGLKFPFCDLSLKELLALSQVVQDKIFEVLETPFVKRQNLLFIAPSEIVELGVKADFIYENFGPLMYSRGSDSKDIFSFFEMHRKKEGGLIWLPAGFSFLRKVAEETFSAIDHQIFQPMGNELGLLISDKKSPAGQKLREAAIKLGAIRDGAYRIINFPQFVQTAAEL